MSALIGEDNRAGHLFVDESAAVLDVTNPNVAGVKVAVLLIHHFVGMPVGGMDSTVTAGRPILPASALRRDDRFVSKMSKHRNSETKADRTSIF